MNLSHCLHSNLDQNGFCILCGFEIQSTIQLTNDLPINPPTTLPTNLPLLTKYKPIHFKKLNELDLITDYLNIKEYKPLILNELQTKSFSSRLSFKDISLLCIYHILKEDSYPILFCDLQKFTKRKLTCDYFKEFGNRNLKEDYLKNVYKRFNDRNDKSKESSYESFKDLIKKNLNKKIEVISMRYFLKEGNGICSERQIKRVDCGGVRGVKEDEGVEDVEDKGINKDKDVKEDIKKSEVKVKFKKTKKSVKERIKEIKKILDA